MIGRKFADNRLIYRSLESCHDPREFVHSLYWSTLDLLFISSMIDNEASMQIQLKCKSGNALVNNLRYRFIHAIDLQPNIHLFQDVDKINIIVFLFIGI